MAKQIAFRINNMSCSACELRIENALRAINGVRKVNASYATGRVTVLFDENETSYKQIKSVILKLNYKIADEHGSKKQKTGAASKRRSKEKEGVLGTVMIILACYFILQWSGLLNRIPQINASMGYFTLFVVGLVTSLHCTAMCGGINIAQCMSYGKEGKHTFFPSLLYNGGRVVSYTIVGGIVGALGSVIGFSGTAKGLVALLAGAFMVIMGLNMLNLFPWLKRLMPRMPKFFGRKVQSSQYGPFVVGLLNGLMPCGPLQAMQLYALGTGSFTAGAVAMFFFSLGTAPLMFGLGAVSTYLKEKDTLRMLKVGAILVVVLGIAMFGNGMALSGIQVPFGSSEKPSQAQSEKNYVNAATIKGNVQEVTTTLGRSYAPITVQKGIPVKWTIQADRANINGCNNQMQIPKYQIVKQLMPGENVIEFIPETTGTIAYSCWMGMIRSSITVVEDIRQ